MAALAATPRDQSLRSRLIAAKTLHVPHLIDVEFLHAVRKLVARGLIRLETANAIREDFTQLPLMRYPHHPHANRIWELRQNLTAYDATFFALAEALQLPLVTCDTRLARSTFQSVSVEVYGSDRG